MGKHEKTLRRVLQGGADANIGFVELCGPLHHLGFEERQRGSHHLFSRTGVEELLNLQEAGAKAKVYQVCTVLLKYGLGRDLLGDDTED